MSDAVFVATNYMVLKNYEIKNTAHENGKNCLKSSYILYGAEFALLMFYKMTVAFDYHVILSTCSHSTHPRRQAGVLNYL